MAKKIMTLKHFSIQTIRIVKVITIYLSPNKNWLPNNILTSKNLHLISKTLSQFHEISWVTMGLNSPTDHLEKPCMYMPSDQIDASGSANRRDQFYACNFISKTSWVILISIEAIDLKQINNLPLSVTVYK